MTKDFYRTGYYEKDSTTYGGKIYPSDYYRVNSMADIAERIISDQKFDMKCKKNAENRDNRKKMREENGGRKDNG